MASRFTNASMILISAIPLLVSVMWGHLVPLPAKEFLYTLALTIKSFLVFALPVIIFFLLAYSLNKLSTNAIFLIVMLLIFIICSNFTAISLGYLFGSLAAGHFNFSAFEPSVNPGLSSIWNFRFPTLASPYVPLAGALLSTIILIFFPSQRVSRFYEMAYRITNLFLKYVFLPIIPLMILGFSLQFQHVGIFSINKQAFLKAWSYIITIQMLYVLAIYLLISNFRIKTWFNYLKNMLPAMVTAFGTASSAATLPLTIECSVKNLNGSNLPRIIVPASSNIHTPGSALGITILCLFIINIFGLQIPSYWDFIQFAAFFTIAKFSVAGIPSGIAIVITPLLITYLGYSEPMIDFLLAVYVFFDPFGTLANVSANGAFAIFLSKHYKKTEIKL